MDIGALFDWDGVIIDSARAHEESWERLAAEERRALPPDHFKRSFGRKNAVVIPEILGWAVGSDEIRRMSLRKEELYREQLAAGGIRPLPGVREFLLSLRDAGVPCAIGSSTDRENIEAVFRLTELATLFTAVVSSEDVQAGKPDPEVFLRGAQAIGRPPARCVVFEDALVGLEAARAGGMKAVAVATTVSPARLAGWADRVVLRLDELSIADLRRIVES